MRISDATLLHSNAPGQSIQPGEGKNLFIVDTVKKLKLTIASSDTSTHPAIGFLNIENLYATRNGATRMEVNFVSGIDNQQSSTYLARFIASLTEVGPLNGVADRVDERILPSSETVTSATQTDGERSGRNIGIQAGLEVHLSDKGVQCSTEPITRPEATSNNSQQFSGYVEEGSNGVRSHERRVFTLVLAYVIRRFGTKMLEMRRRKMGTTHIN